MTYRDFIGIPWKRNSKDFPNSLDCWGVVWCVYKHMYDITLPTLEDINVDIQGEEEAVELLEKNHIKNLYKQFTTVDKPREGDVVYLRIQGHPLHVGVMIDNYNMIHSSEKCGCVVEKINSTKWRNRIISIHRHKSFL